MRRVGAFLAFAISVLLVPIALADDQTVTVGPGTAFTPASVTVTVGDTVTFNWPPGSANHSVTFDDGSFDTDVRNGPYSQARTFTAPGIYRYHCKVHGGSGGSGMSGQVNVGGTAPSPTPTPRPTSASPTPRPTPTRTPTPVRTTASPTRPPTPSATPTASSTASASPSGELSESPTEPVDGQTSAPAVVSPSPASLPPISSGDTGSGTGVALAVGLVVAVVAFTAAVLLLRRTR